MDLKKQQTDNTRQQTSAHTPQDTSDIARGIGLNKIE